MLAGTYSLPACIYSWCIIPVLLVTTAPITASKLLLSTVALIAVSVKSTPSATVPKSPYELLPLVARILPPASAR